MVGVAGGGDGDCNKDGDGDPCPHRVEADIVGYAGRRSKSRSFVLIGTRETAALALIRSLPLTLTQA